MRRRYISLVCTPGFAYAHLLIFESELKWAECSIGPIPPSLSSAASSPPSLEAEPSAPPLPLTATTSEGSSLLTSEQRLLSGNGSNKGGAKYVMRLDGLFFVGVSHAHFNSRFSMSAVLKSAFLKLTSSSTSSSSTTDTPKSSKVSAVNRDSENPAGSAVSFSAVHVILGFMVFNYGCMQQLYQILAWLHNALFINNRLSSGFSRFF